MLRTILTLPDGTQLSSGAKEQNVVQSITITQCVNASQELTLGSCCANMVEATLLTPGGAVQLAAGDEITVHRVDDDGAAHPVGIFVAEKPERPSANTLRITAYDRVIRLDKDLTQWLAGLDAWPYSLLDFAQMVCSQCGLNLANEEIPNGEYAVDRFSADGVTGRQLMQWIGEVAGRFCRATVQGDIEFAWYIPVNAYDIGITPYDGSLLVWEQEDLFIRAKEMTVTDNGNGHITLDSPLLTVTEADSNAVVTLAPDAKTLMFYQNGLSFADYVVAPIEKVQLRQNEEDVGTVYPDGMDSAVNTYIVTANPLLAAKSATTLLPIAQSLYTMLQGVSYTPCKVNVPANLHIQPGHMVRICDRNGKTITVYVMTKTQKGQRDTLECTGSHTRDSTTAANNRSYQALSGKLLNLRTDVDGLKLENKDSADKFSKLELDIDGIRGAVSQQSTDAAGIKTQLTQLQQTAQGLTVSVQNICDEGATKIKTAMGYTFDDAGLHIAKEGQPMENKLNHEGMLVTRNGQTVLQADHRGVTAVDVSVGNYLVMGKHARFEDFGAGRTACFWLEG